MQRTILPPDITRLIASVRNMKVRDILNLCEVDRNMNRSICRNALFWNVLLRERSGYNDERLQGFLNDIPRTQRELHSLENPLTPEKAHEVFLKTSWMVGNLKPETIFLTERGQQRRSAAEPSVYNLLSRKFTLPSPFIIALPRYRTDDGMILPNVNVVDLVELELSTPVSILEMIVAISNYYLEEAAAAPHLEELRFIVRHGTLLSYNTADFEVNANGESILDLTRVRLEVWEEPRRRR